MKSEGKPANSLKPHLSILKMLKMLKPFFLDSKRTREKLKRINMTFFIELFFGITM